MKFIFCFVVICVCCVSPLKANETVLVTAATGYFGQTVCMDLAKKGYDLVILGRSLAKLQKLKSEIKRKFPKIHVHAGQINFSHKKTITDAYQALHTHLKLKGIVLIGPRPSLVKAGMPSPEAWETVFKECFITPLEVIRLFEKHLQPGARIVIISGLSSKYHIPEYPNTNVIRMAWTAEVKNLASQLGPRGIGVNAISPGVILTPYHQKRIAMDARKNNVSYAEELTKQTAALPLKSYGQLSDVAATVSYLLSPQSKHITGSNIALDGGQSLAY